MEILYRRESCLSGNPIVLRFSSIISHWLSASCVHQVLCINYFYFVPVDSSVVGLLSQCRLK